MKLFLFVLVVSFSGSCFAVGKANTFAVDLVRVDQNGKGYVKFTQNLVEHNGAKPTCGSTHARQLAFDTKTPAGQAIYSLALSAKSSGKRIWALGTGTCDVYSVVESWSTGVIRD